MSKKRLTAWFPASVKPARDGVYEVRPLLGHIQPWFSYRRGGQWLGTTSTANKALSFGRKYGPTGDGELEWRGLASDPKGKA